MKKLVLAFSLFAAVATVEAGAKTWPANYWSSVVPSSAAAAVPTPTEVDVQPYADLDIGTGYFGIFDSIVGFCLVESPVFVNFNIIMPGMRIIIK